MGNITCMSLKHTLTDNAVSEALDEINDRRFDSYFRIERDPEWGRWEFFAPGLTFHKNPITYPVWSMCRESPRRIGGKSPRPNTEWIQWAWWQFYCEMTTRFGGVITDEGVDGGIKPDAYVGENFQGFLKRRYSHLLPEIREGILAQSGPETIPESFRKVAYPL